MENNIEIVIQDKVDSSISTKLKSIANDAREAHSAISLLKSELSKINSSAISNLSSQFNKLFGTFAKFNNEQIKTETQ